MGYRVKSLQQFVYYPDYASNLLLTSLTRFHSYSIAYKPRCSQTIFQNRAGLIEKQDQKFLKNIYLIPVKQ